MYKPFFGLKESPFKITPDLDFFFRQSSRDFSLQSLKYAIDHGEGVVKVVGEVGAGKTTLLRLLLKSLPSKFVAILLPSPTLSPKEVLLFICQELSLSYSAEHQKHDLVRMISNALIQNVFLDKQLILLVDESQSCSLDTLEEIRLLSNLETEKRKLVQIVLFGQTELDITLNSLEAKPLKARISSAIYLDEFSDKEVQQYLNYRMRVAGYAGEDLFSLPIAKEITRMTQGLPRAINIVADKLLLLAFSKGTRGFSIKMLKQLPGYQNNDSRVSFLKYGVVILISVLVLYFAYYFYKMQDKALLKGNVSVVSHLDMDVQYSVLNQFILKTSDVYQKLPKFFYTGLLATGNFAKANAKLIELETFLTDDQQAKVFVFCKNDLCAVLYGYSNNRHVVVDTLNTLSLPKTQAFKTISISDVDAIIE